MKQTFDEKLLGDIAQSEWEPNNFVINPQEKRGRAVDCFYCEKHKHL